jgi:hypothetical protein
MIGFHDLFLPTDRLCLKYAHQKIAYMFFVFVYLMFTVIFNLFIAFICSGNGMPKEPLCPSPGKRQIVDAVHTGQPHIAFV